MEQKGKTGFSGQYHFEIWREGKCIDSWDEYNLIPDEGLNSVLGVYCHGDAQIITWYMGITSGVYTPAVSDTGANIVARATEITTYAEATRHAVTFAAPAAKAITNAAARATFTMNAGATINGAFVVSTSTKSAITGTLLSSLALGVPKAVVAGDQVLATFTLSAASV